MNWLQFKDKKMFPYTFSKVKISAGVLLGLQMENILPSPDRARCPSCAQTRGQSPNRLRG